MDFGKLNIFTGHFGSGKTEIAVNFSIMLNNKSYKTALVDMDVVNPYFRSADVKKDMEDKGITVITPLYAGTNTDVPALPGEINRVFQDENMYSVLDVGGDDLGAKVVSTYKSKIQKTDYRHFFVINVNRPQTSDVKGITRYVHEIENASGLKVTGLVNNTNLMNLTTIDDIIKGGKTVKDAAEKLGVKLSFHSVMDKYVDEYAKIIKNDSILPINKYLGNMWGVQ